MTSAKCAVKQNASVEPRYRGFFTFVSITIPFKLAASYSLTHAKFTTSFPVEPWEHIVWFASLKD